jgi:hypothetical protein
MKANGEPGLAARRARQELAERDEIAEGPLVEPAAPHDELNAEIAEMGDRAAEAGQAELREDAQDFEGRTPRRAHAVAAGGWSMPFCRRLSLIRGLGAIF